MTIAIEERRGRTIVSGGRELLSFGGCDYLGLAVEPRVIAAAGEGLRRWGLSASASRTTSGTFAEHRELERELAAFLGRSDCALLADGALADAALLLALASEHGEAAIDAAAHPALTDAARAAGIAAAPFEPPAPPHDVRCVLSDGVYPLAGRAAQVSHLLAALAGPHAHAVIDDSHGFGVFGTRGAGVCEGFDDRRLVITGSLAKALGCAGGFVAGENALLERVRASSAYIGTTPIPPAVAAAARAALALVSEEPRRARLAARTTELAALAPRLGAAPSAFPFPVRGIPVPDGRSGEEFRLLLSEQGIAVPFVHYFGAPQGGVFRVAVSAAHEPGDLERLEEAWTHCRRT